MVALRILVTVVLVSFFHLRAGYSGTHSAASNNSEADTKPDFSQEPIVFEYIHESMRYESDGSGVRETQAKIRVQTNAGLNFAGQLAFNYNAADEKLEVRSVRVLKKDGATLTAGPEAVQDLSAPLTQGAPVYTDARQKHVTVPGVSVNDVVEYDVVTTVKPVLPGHFWSIWTFTDKFIALHEQLDLNVPNSVMLKIKNPAGIEPSVSGEGDRRIYHWATSNLKTPLPVDLFKNFEFDVVKLLGGRRSAPPPRVMFSTFQSWNDVAEWYRQLEHDRRIPTPEIRAKAEEITRGLKTPAAKAQALYYWVSQNIRYVSLSFGVGRYQPHAAAEVLLNRYGDCKDKTTLLEALLEAEGLHADPVLVNAVAEIDPDMPNPLQFDHAIALLRIENQDTWLDSTVGVGPYGYLLPQLRNSEALVISDSCSTQLQKLPIDLPFSVEYRIAVKGKVDEQGNLDGNVELQTRGDLEVLIRVLDSRLSKDQLTKSADGVLTSSNKYLYGGPQYADFTVANASDTSVPVKTQFHVTGKLMSVNSTLTPSQIAASLGSLAMDQVQSLSQLPRAGGKAASQNIASSESIELKGPASYSVNAELTFAKLPDSNFPPAKEVHVKEQFGEFQSRDSWEGNTFHSFKSLELRVPRVPASQSNEYARFVSKISEAPPMLMGLQKESKAAPSPATASQAESKYTVSPEVQAMYKHGEDEGKRKNWANAIEAFGNATKAAPKYPDAWRELGRAHMYARQFPEADAAFRRYLELAPSDHLAYLNMAWVLFSEKKFEEEKELMLKRIAVAPDDGDALFRLGTAYLALKQPALAVPVLERSIVQFPKYIAAYMALGQAYLENHQELPGQATLRKAVSIDDSENSLNTAAYLLGEHKVAMDLAETWSKPSIEILEKELNNSTVSNVQSSTWALVSKLSHYWDTLGWIYFRQGKMDEAQKYLLAAWQIWDDPTISYHLGRIYETQGRKDESTELYLAALNSFPPNGTLSDDGKDMRTRLVESLGSDAEVDKRLEQSRKKKSPLRTVNIANPSREQGIAQYAIIIDANSRAVEISSTGAEDPLASVGDSMRAATMPQSFPDATLKKLPRLGTLACSSVGEPCVLTLLTPLAASRLVALE